jgi:phage gp36-like protein
MASDHVPATARGIRNVTTELIDKATAELLALIDARLPERFYSGEPTWRLVLTAMIARMAGLLESQRLLAAPERQSDALLLLRALWEHGVTFMWLAIDPGPRVEAWRGHTLLQRKRLHHDALDYGAEVLSDSELADAAAAERVEPLLQRAQEIDDYWAPRIRGLYTNPPTGPKHILTVRGQYVAIYRLASRQMHATIDCLDGCLREHGRRWIVEREHPSDSLLWSALGLPIVSMVLVVAAERLGWPDEDEVRAINDALTHEETSSSA